MPLRAKWFPWLVIRFGRERHYAESWLVKNSSLGYLEVQGLADAIVAADAMVKTALVRLVGALQLNPGRITLTVEGDLAACRAAVDAGRLAVMLHGIVWADLVIGRPEPDTEQLTQHLAEGMGDRCGNDACD